MVFGSWEKERKALCSKLSTDLPSYLSPTRPSSGKEKILHNANWLLQNYSSDSDMKNTLKSLILNNQTKTTHKIILMSYN